MDRRNLLIFALASLVALLLGVVYFAIVAVAHLNLNSAAFGGMVLLFAIGGALGFVSWLLGLMHTARVRQWDWFVAILLLGPVTTLLYCRFGREAEAAA